MGNVSAIGIIFCSLLRGFRRDFFSCSMAMVLGTLGSLRRADRDGAPPQRDLDHHWGQLALAPHRPRAGKDPPSRWLMRPSPSIHT